MPENTDMIHPIGREAFFEDLKAHLRSAHCGRGGFVLIRGEAGIGKTKLIEAFIQFAKEQGFLTLVGRCLSREGCDPYLPLIDAFKDAKFPKEEYVPKSQGVASMSLLPMSGRPHGSHKTSGRYEMGPMNISDILRGLPMSSLLMAGAPAGTAFGITIDPLDKEEFSNGRDRMYSTFSEILSSLASDSTLVLVLDDLHWADISTLDILRRLSFRIKDERILIIGTYRTEEVTFPNSDEHPLLSFIHELKEREMVSEMELQRLSEDETSTLVTSILGRDGYPSGFMEWVYNQCEGSPLLIEELLYTLKSEGPLEDIGSRGAWRGHGEHDRGAGSDVFVPSNAVRDLLRQRIGNLDKDSIRVIQYASVMGRSFGQDMLRELLNIPDPILERSIDNLVEANLIRCNRDEEGGFRFSSAFLETMVYKEMSRSRRRVIHRKVADLIERRNEGRLQPVVHDLAHHFKHARVSQKAVMYLSLAGDRDISVYAIEEAMDHYRDAHKILSEVPKTPSRLRDEVRLTTLMSRYEAILGNWSEALRYIDLALSNAHELEDDGLEVESLLNRGRINSERNKCELALGDLREGLELSKKMDDLERVALSLRYIGSVYWFMCDFDAAIDSLKQSSKCAKGLGNDSLLATALGDLGSVYRDKGDWRRAVDLLERAISILRRLDSKFELVRALNNLGAVYRYMDEWETALKNFEDCISISKEINYTKYIGYGLKNAAECYARQGRLEEAQEACDKGRSIFTMMGHLAGLAYIEMVEGLIHMRRCQWDEAEAKFKMGLKLANELGWLDLIGDVSYEYGKMLLDAKRFEDSSVHLHHAKECFERIGAKQRGIRVKKKLKALER